MFPHIFQENDLLRLSFFGSTWLAVREAFALQANNFVVTISNQFLRLDEFLRNNRNWAILTRLISLIDIGVSLEKWNLKIVLLSFINPPLNDAIFHLLFVDNFVGMFAETSA